LREEKENMLTADQLVALAEAHRETLEREIRLQHLFSQLPRQPARWRKWTGSSLMWAGAMLVSWGEGVSATRGRQRFEIAS
jgi:hypothetical protein